MNIFITGISGFIGNKLSQYFIEKGHNVIGSSSSRQTEITKNNIISLPLGVKPEFGLFKNTDLVIHCAYDQNTQNKSNNFIGTELIYRAAKEDGVRLQIYISSISATNYNKSEYGDIKIK